MATPSYRVPFCPLVSFSLSWPLKYRKDTEVVFAGACNCHVGCAYDFGVANQLTWRRDSWSKGKEDYGNLDRHAKTERARVVFIFVTCYLVTDYIETCILRSEHVLQKYVTNINNSFTMDLACSNLLTTYLLTKPPQGQLLIN